MANAVHLEGVVHVRIFMRILEEGGMVGGRINDTVTHNGCSIPGFSHPATEPRRGFSAPDRLNQVARLQLVATRVRGGTVLPYTDSRGRDPSRCRSGPLIRKCRGHSPRTRQP